jgi:hypothetical protein
MSKRKLQSYNRYGKGGDLMDVAWRGVKANKLTWEDARAIQNTLQPDCVGCGERFAGKILMEKKGYCETCFRKFVAARMEGRQP